MTTPHSPTTVLDPAELGAIVGRLFSFANRWSEIAKPDPERRWHAHLHVENSYDVWLLGWDHAQGIDLHDHGGSAGAFCVIKGRLIEAHIDPRSSGRTQRRHVEAGETVSFGANHVHDLLNPGPAVAISVHAYSPPLSTMTFYDDAPGTFLARVRTETV